MLPARIARASRLHARARLRIVFPAACERVDFVAAAARAHRDASSASALSRAADRALVRAKYFFLSASARARSSPVRRRPSPPAS